MKYIYLQYDNAHKNKSFEDNVYYTLIDIFNNASSSNLVLRVHDFNNFLKNDKGYTRILYDKEYLSLLIHILQHVNESSFEMILDDGDYIRMSDWLIQFEELKSLLAERYRQANMT